VLWRSRRLLGVRDPELDEPITTPRLGFGVRWPMTRSGPAWLPNGWCALNFAYLM